MARVDLNIVDRGTSSTKWTPEDVALTAEHLDEVMEQKTDNSGALNSLPTPFARFFVAREAFRRAYEEKLNPRKEAGFAYRQMVSDILDVYEMLFNLKYHKNNTWKDGQKIELRQWNSEENLKYIKEKMPILYNSIEDYYKTDIKEKNLYFLIFTENGKDILLACSSPITRKSGGEYFRDIKLFGEREADFKNYMYTDMFGSDTIDERLKSIKEYIRSFRNDPAIRNDYTQRLAAVNTDQNDPLVVNGLAFKALDEIDITSYFTDTILRVPYRISRETFQAVKYQNDNAERTYDYLLPFKPEVLNLFEGLEIDSDIHINRNSVTASLRYNGKTYEKEYAQDPFRAGQGRIVDLQTAKISFDLGLFPNILSHKYQENNYFKVLVVAADEDADAPNFNIDQISLSFFKKENEDCKPIGEVTPESNAQFGVGPAVVRSRQKTDEEESGTKFYELFNTSFDLIEVNVMGNTV